MCAVCFVLCCELRDRVCCELCAVRIEDLSGECVVSRHAREPLAFEMCAVDMGMWGLVCMGFASNHAS